VIANNDLICATKVIKCPFSDHDFVLVGLNFPSKISTCDFYYARKLDDAKFQLIWSGFDVLDYSFLFDTAKNVDEKWLILKEHLLKIIDDIAPLQKLKASNKSSNPWFDAELNEIKKQRDSSYL
jgi:hypothetical protein